MKNHLTQSVQNSLQVSINPPSVSAAAAGSQKQTIQTGVDISLYNAGASALTITQVALSIPVEFSTDVVLAQSSTSSWTLISADVPGDYLATLQTGSIGIAAKATADLSLSVAVLNQSPGTINFLVKVYFDQGDPVTYQPQVKIEAIEASIINFYTTSPGILVGQSATLQWNTTGIDHCIITPYDPPGNQLANSSVGVSPNYTTVYTLYAYATGIILAAQVTVTVTKAEGAISLKSGSDKINRGDMVTLIWTSNQYTKSVNVSCNDSTIVFPATFNNNGKATVGPVTNNTTFQLTCGDTDPIAPDYQTSVDAFIAPPVIDTFTANPDSDVWANDAVTLSWTTTSVAAVTITSDSGLLLNPAGTSVVVNPAVDTIYTINAIGANDANGKPMQATPVTMPKLSVQALDILRFECDPEYISPQQPPNQGSLSWVTFAQVINIDNGIGAVNNVDNGHVITAPADGSTYTIAISTSQTPSVQVKQTITIHNGYGPFSILSTSYDAGTNFTTLTLNPTPGLSELESQQIAGTLYKVAFAGITFNYPIAEGYVYYNNTFQVQGMATINGTATLSIAGIVWQP